MKKVNIVKFYYEMYIYMYIYIYIGRQAKIVSEKNIISASKQERIYTSTYVH